MPNNATYNQMKIASDCQPHIEISYVKPSKKTGIQRVMCAYPFLKLRC